MSKYIEFQTRKIISRYGGVGSIIETPKGALKIEEFDKWYFFNKKDNLFDLPEFEIEDERLLKRLQFRFVNLKKLIKVPINYSNPFYKSEPSDRKKVAGAEYFPRWMYCSYCGSFKPIKEWYEGWKQTLQKYNINNDIDEKFTPPKCWICYDNARKNKKKHWYHELEQVRFIMTAPNGEIRDIPWERWTLAEKGIKEEDSESGTIRLDWINLCCENQDLKYIKSNKFADLSGIRIECKSCGRKNTLAGLFGLRYRVKAGEDIFLKPVIRTSNSVYYPLIINSIYLPKKESITIEDQKFIKDLFNRGKKINFICEAIDNKYNKSTIEDFINSMNNGFETETLYRLKEYNFLTQNPDSPDSDSNDLNYQTMDITNLSEYGIEHLIKIKRLKLTMVQTGYTRQKPLDKDIFMQEGDKNEIKIKYTSEKAINTEYLLGVENFGEGIFVSFKNSKVENWISECYEQNIELKERIEKIIQRIDKNEFLAKGKFIDEKHLIKFYIIHTLSHILIKELEFLCGYSSASLGERLYVDNNNMQGVLIYTIAGSEGSYGGLVTQAESEKFEKILSSSLFRAHDCASDPVCYYSDGQGIGGLNFAACYSCALLPETSCEEFNLFLDRRILIDEKFGFLK